ncbi:hypothetical protein N7G274_010374 [Stereocaulon virgatum]|uniref:Major facilitator superfamily (MFS) profile domain-containing protein n=1 Tax=Stereocaulon virgatum TaxID=373712 RepID=A0ABR3ZW03_9LECA
MGNAEEITSAGALARPAFAEENLTNNEHGSTTTTSTFDVERQPNSEIDKTPNAKIRAVGDVDSVNDSTNIVDFDGPDDPENSINWSPAYKWSLVVLISFMSCVVNLAILMCAPATPSILLEFHSQSHLSSTILLSIWEAGETIGPLLVGPLSEIYGRLPIYNAANIAFILFSAIAAKSQAMPMLITMRFFLGASVASTTLNPCIVGDMFRQKERGGALAVMGMTPFIAPILGPVVGGFISQVKGWRWTFWLVTIICGAFEVGFLLLCRESYKITILEKSTRRSYASTSEITERLDYPSVARNVTTNIKRNGTPINEQEPRRELQMAGIGRYEQCPLIRALLEIPTLVWRRPLSDQVALQMMVGTPDNYELHPFFGIFWAVDFLISSVLLYRCTKKTSELFRQHYAHELVSGACYYTNTAASMLARNGLDNSRKRQQRIASRVMATILTSTAAASVQIPARLLPDTPGKIKHGGPTGWMRAATSHA